MMSWKPMLPGAVRAGLRTGGHRDIPQRPEEHQWIPGRVEPVLMDLSTASLDRHKVVLFMEPKNCLGQVLRTLGDHGKMLPVELVLKRQERGLIANHNGYSPGGKGVVETHGEIAGPTQAKVELAAAHVVLVGGNQISVMRTPSPESVAEQQIHFDRTIFLNGLNRHSALGMGKETAERQSGLR
jgi:hypothetical protein